MADDKHWAQSYLIDPLTAPDPSQETGPNAHFRSTFAPASAFTKSPESTPAVSLREHTTGTSTSTDTNPFRRRSGSVNNAYPSPPNSASPRKENFSPSHRQDAFASYKDEPTGRPRRSSSLKARYPGDKSHEPLAILRKDSKKAYRSPHLSKKHLPRADMIDRLDVQPYHHEGPYDAVLAVRNTSSKHSPLAAVADSNAEALKATPMENIQDSLRRHRPLDGTATIPSGQADRFGTTYEYEEGTDMMRDPLVGGHYKRWPGQHYHPDDLKGKGEPSYSIEKALKDHKAYGDHGIEMTSNRSRNKSLGHLDRENAIEEGVGINRSHSTGRRVSDGLKRRFGSLRRKKNQDS